MRTLRLWIALAAALIVSVASAQSQVTLTAAEYFFDTDPGYGQATPITNVVEGEQTLDIPTSSLSVGVHILCLRSMGSNGVWSSTLSHPIYVMHMGGSTASHVEYFFDQDPGYGRGTVLTVSGSQDVTLDIPTSDITPGAHMLYLRSQDTNGHWSPVVAHPLYVFSVLPVVALEYFIDDVDPGEGKAIDVPIPTATAATATFDIDTSSLTAGEHSLNIRAMGIDSVWTAVSTRTFRVEGPAVAEAYAALSEGNTVLTFYYDDKKTERNGMGIGPFNPSLSGAWGSASSSITDVVFDASFAEYTGVTSTANWFARCSKLKSISGWENLNTSAVTDMGNMFFGCEQLDMLDLSSFNTAEVTNMDGMFRDCTILKVVILSSFNTEKVQSMNSMFYGCENMVELDLSNFATPNLTNTGYMFFGCANLATVYASTQWTADNVTESALMFSGCTNLVGGQGTAFTTAQTDKGYARIDEVNSTSGTPGYFTDKNAPAVAEAYAALSSDGLTVTFYYDDKKAERGGIDINNSSSLPSYNNATTAVFDASFADYRPTSTAHWFRNCIALSTIIGIENLKTDDVTNMECMFWQCPGLTSLDVSNFNTAKVTDMNTMFGFCSGLTSLDVSNFNTANVADMNWMFYDCSGLTSLDVSNFNTANVTDMSDMFSGCSGLTSLDVSSFNTGNVTNMSRLFYGCSSLTTIYAGSEWSIAAVTESENMFSGCTSLVGGMGTVYDADHIDAAYAHIDGGVSNPGYLTDKNASPIPSGDVEAPVIAYNGRYVTLTSATADAQIYYTLDGSAPTAASAAYNGQVEMTQLCTVRAIAAKSGQVSDVTAYEVRYLFNGITAWVEQPGMLDDAFEWCGGRSVAAQTIASVVSLSNAEPLSASMLDGLDANPNLLVYVNDDTQVPAGIQNVVVKGYAKQILLTDVTSGNGNFYVPQEFMTGEISYTREFTQQTENNVSRGWESIALPFSVETITHEKNGALYPFGAEATNGHRFWLRQLTPSGLARATRIVSNRPYVISMPNNPTLYADEFNQAGRVTFASKNVIIPATSPVVSALADGSISMTPTTIRVAQSGAVYALNVGVPYASYREGSIFVSGLRDVKPFEAYTSHSEGTQGGSRVISLDEMGMGEATGIDDVMASGRGTSGAPVYDLQGRRVVEPNEAIDSKLQRGVYIQQGRKVIVGR